MFQFCLDELENRNLKLIICM